MIREENHGCFRYEVRAQDYSPLILHEIDPQKRPTAYSHVCFQWNRNARSMFISHFWSRNYGMFFVKQKSEPRILRALGCFFRGVPFWNQKINICLIPRTLVSYSCCILSCLLVLFHMWASYSNITAD